MLNRAILIYCSVYITQTISGQSQLQYILVDSIESNIKIENNSSALYSPSNDNIISYFSENDSGLVSIERLYFDTSSNSFALKFFKVQNHEKEPYCYSLAFTNNWLYLQGQDVISKYKLVNNTYVLIDTFHFQQSFEIFGNCSKFYAIDSSNLLFSNNYPNDTEFNIPIIIFDYQKRKIIEDKSIHVGKSLLLSYEAVIDLFDYFNDRIVFSPAGTNLISVYDLKLEKINTIEIPFHFNTNIKDTIEKYLPDKFVNKNIHSPKAIIEIMGKTYGKNIFSMQQIRSLQLLNDSTLLVIVNTNPMDFYTENVLYLVNLNNNEITSSIEKLQINYFTFDLPYSYYRGISQKGKDYFVLRDEKFNDSSNTINTYYKIYQRIGIESFIDNSLKISNNTFFIYNYKNQPIITDINNFDEYSIIDGYHCKTCIVDKTRKILFLSISQSSVVDNYKLQQAYKKEYPNCELYFINPKYYNLKGVINKLFELAKSN